MMVLYLFLSGVLLTRLRRPVSRLTVSEQQLEGELRYVNSRLITNAEEVAFYRGNKREKLTMLTAFQRLVAHLRRFLQFRFTMGFVDNIIAKYLATVVGFFVVSRPFFSDTHHLATATASQRLEVGGLFRFPSFSFFVPGPVQSSPSRAYLNTGRTTCRGATLNFLHFPQR